MNGLKSETDFSAESHGFWLNLYFLSFPPHQHKHTCQSVHSFALLAFLAWAQGHQHFWIFFVKIFAQTNQHHLQLSSQLSSLFYFLSFSSPLAANVALMQKQLCDKTTEDAAQFWTLFSACLQLLCFFFPTCFAFPSFFAFAICCIRFHAFAILCFLFINLSFRYATKAWDGGWFAAASFVVLS